jgi:hypothetical protein
VNGIAAATYCSCVRPQLVAMKDCHAKVGQRVSIVARHRRRARSCSVCAQRVRQDVHGRDVCQPSPTTPVMAEDVQRDDATRTRRDSVEVRTRRLQSGRAGLVASVMAGSLWPTAALAEELPSQWLGLFTSWVVCLETPAPRSMSVPGGSPALNSGCLMTTAKVLVPCSPQPLDPWQVLCSHEPHCLCRTASSPSGPSVRSH